MTKSVTTSARDFLSASVLAIAEPSSLDKFERRERAKAARAALSGNNDARTLTRDYRILAQARGTIEGKALHQLRCILFERVRAICPHIR